MVVMVIKWVVQGQVDVLECGIICGDFKIKPILILILVS
jgi:hypothetical protein